MSTVVFLGPTLAVADAARVLDAQYRAPAAQGDVYAAAEEGARAIGIVDGYFERVPAVWHKEVLWALARGVHVFGASSMGALRAAELHTHGMRGVGRVFEAFRDGALTDDDEVTVVHGAAESGYRVASDAMVNIRFTVAAAEAEGVIGAATAQRLVARAKDTFYPYRRWATLLDAAGSGVADAELDALRAWLPDGRVDRKRLDALEMLQQMHTLLAADPPPLRVRFRFQHTDAWEQVRRQIDSRAHAAAVPAAPREHAAILDEVRLSADGGAAAREAALLRALALALAEPAAGDAALEHTVAAFRAAHSLHDADAVRRWREAQRLGEEDLHRLLDEEARIGRVRAIYGADLERPLVDWLRVTGAYGAIAARAQQKQEALAAHGLENPSLSLLGLTEADLFRWFFHDAGGAAPADPAAAAAEHGFDSVDAFRRAVLREYCFRHRVG